MPGPPIKPAGAHSIPIKLTKAARSACGLSRVRGPVPFNARSTRPTSIWRERVNRVRPIAAFSRGKDELRPPLTVQAP